MALAERLGRSRAVVSEWRAGKSYPDEDLIVALAELAGDDPGEWLLAIKAVRTEGKAGKFGRHWRSALAPSPLLRYAR